MTSTQAPSGISPSGSSNKSPARIERILSTHPFPRWDGHDLQTYQRAIDRHAQDLQRQAATHVLINDLPLSPLQIMDPENSYLRFTTYGHSLDKFFSTPLIQGIYHPSLLEANRKLLLWNASLAKRYGFRCYIRCTEMTLLPESFFKRHPALRGPRVDNPTASTTPMFSLCPELPEVQEHYRLLMKQAMELVPDLDEMHLFTCDSGGGFCYAKHLYSGSNGPVHCRHIPTGKQAQTFCRTLIDEARKVNPDFRVVMTSGLMLEERNDLLDGAPAGLAASVYGALAWGGGLEERWANHALGPAILQPGAREKARAWQLNDMRRRSEQITSRGGAVYASYNVDYYSGPSDAPRPFEVHQNVQQYISMGVRSLIGGGPSTKWHANTAILLQSLQGGPTDTDEAVRQLATEWVGQTHADALCRAWKESDMAERLVPWLPHNGHSVFVQPLIMDMPIVPDETKLSPRDLDYFYTPVIRDEERMKSNHGGPWRFVHMADSDKRYVLEQFERVTMPAQDRAIALLEEMLRTDSLTADARECVLTQRNEIVVHRCYAQRLRNWVRASFHRCVGSKPFSGLASLPTIIRDEADNTQLWRDCVSSNAGFIAGPQASATKRAQLMLAHADDAPAMVDLREFPFQKYPGLAPQ